MERLYIARHGESELSVRGIVSGKPDVPCGLTTRGKEQAAKLRDRIAHEPIPLVVTSDFERCKLTAQIAASDRNARWLELSELGDIRAGAFEGEQLVSYLRWAHSAPAGEPAPGGGEGRAAAARRFAAGLRILLAQPEPNALAISHQVTIRYLLLAARGANPRAKVEAIPHATPYTFSAQQLRRAADTLNAWATNPDW